MIEVVEIPFGRAKAFPLKKGEVFRISVPRGGQVADMTFPYFHQALTRRINGSSKEGGARLIFQADSNTTFYDGAGKAILKLIQNRSRARHDLLYPGCSRAAPDDPDGCRELLSEAIGIPLRELPAVCTFFMDVEDGVILPSSSDPGDNVTLKVLDDVLVGVSACPAQNCNPTPGEIVVEIDHCMTGEEQARGYELRGSDGVGWEPHVRPALQEQEGE